MARLRLSENTNLEFRAEGFDIFNHPDFDIPSASTSLYSVTKSGNVIRAVTVRAPSASPGLIQQTIGGPRVFQLSMHLNF